MSERVVPRFSVVVPALDEAATIERTLRSARRALGPDTELIVSDGGSRDRTRQLAGAHARVVRSAPGRGPQLNAGAGVSLGDVLVFLHADTVLETGTGARIETALSDPEVAGGCCRFAVDPTPRRGDRFFFLELGVNLRTSVFRTATGDQAIFARRSAFDAVGGFPELPLFEDVVFVRSLRRVGSFRPIRAIARTSRRRWELEGFGRTVLTHWLLRGAFAARVPPARLATWYDRSWRGDRGAVSPARRETP